MLYNIIVPEPSISFYVMCDHVTVTCNICDIFVTIMLIPNLKFKNQKINRKIKINSLLSLTLIPKVHSNQAEYQTEYSVTQLQNDEAVQSEILIKHCQIVEAYWLVTEEGRLVVKKKSEVKIV